MINAKNMLIWEIVLLIIIVGIITCVFVVEMDLGIFKIMSPQKLASQYDSIVDMNSRIVTSKNNYDSSLKTIETAKKDYTREKEKYESITDETIAIIKEATSDEQYNIDYIWITIGNYASANNLSLSLVEPGGSSSASSTPATNNESQTTTSTTTETNNESQTTTSTTTETKNDEQVTSQTSDTEKASNTIPTPKPPASPVKNSGSEFSIKVVGDYIDVSSFIFELENDIELRFKLDNIKMEYAGNNQITATFAVKNLKFKK